MKAILHLVNILLFIVLPLLLLYLRSNWSRKEINFYVVILPLLWYLFYAPIHEFSHIIGCWLVGAEINDFRLFAHFWKGEFGFAYVDVKGGMGVNTESLIILIVPYVLDLISILLGYFIITRLDIKNSFLVGLVFMIFCLRPLYDIVDNYMGIYFNHSDLVMIKEIIGSFITYSYGIITATIGVLITVNILNRYKSFS